MSDLNSVIRSGIKSGECTSKFATDLCDVLNSIGLYTSPYPIAPEAPVAPVALRSKFIRMLQACVDKRLNVSASGIKTYSYVVSYENNGTTFFSYI